MVEHRTFNPRVEGSSPSGPTALGGILEYHHGASMIHSG
jgi:hypothetical protein